MKKILICLMVVVLLTGCVNINNASIDKVVSLSINNKHNLTNENNRGFKYYIPREVVVKEQDSFNVVFKNKSYNYYMYVDLVSYFYKTKMTYEVEKDIYYSKLINKKDKNGIVNIYKSTIEDGAYLIKVSYNYASISAIVKEKDINDSLSNMLIILSSIKYNDSVVKKVLQNNLIDSSEEQVNVFKIESKTVDTLDVDDTYTGEDDEDYDPDVIN